MQPITRKGKQVWLPDVAHKDEKEAPVGATGMAKSMEEIDAKTRRVNARLCDTMEEAREWLVQEPDSAKKG